eukprot:TRINITY_DN3340_c2_g1_i2.p1 TRINITY_DN3340_c2_g1~~TRINITY_DN3340_c2_g1_i2.p1  ORF type:complete len:455 (+),score=74.17 TRINITY_DN3340_c2_g1_i2:97-1461(+)
MNRQKRWLYGLLLILVLLGCTVGWSFSDMIDDEAHHAGATQQDLDCLRKGLGCGAIERQPDPPVGSETKGMEEVHIDLVARHDIEEWTPPTLPPLRDPSVPCPDKYLTVNTHTWGRHHNQLQSVVHGILMAHLLNRTFVLGHFRHAKAWHDVRSFYSFEELGRYFCIKDAASAQLLHERSVGCFGQDIHDMPLGKQNHLKCDPKALFPKSFPIPGFKTTIETAIPKLRAAQQRLINLSGELAFFLRPGLRFMAMGYGLLRPSKEVQEEVDRFSKATYGEGQDYIAIHLRYREGTCSAEIETDFVKNFNISPKLLGELHAQCKVNFTYTSVTLRNVLGISSTGDPNILPYPAFLASDHQNKAAEMDLLTKGAVFYSGKYHTEEIGGLHGLATDYFLLRKGSVFIGNSASSVSQNTCFARLLTMPWKRACTGWDISLFHEMTTTAAASLALSIFKD